jgi:hypothetical protein
VCTWIVLCVVSDVVGRAVARVQLAIPSDAVPPVHTDPPSAADGSDAEAEAEAEALPIAEVASILWHLLPTVLWYSTCCLRVTHACK